jgi:3-hydroxybutyryl-CoA dehydratase
MTKIEQEQIDAYADVSGDRNPLHVDPAFAATTSFGTTIAHGHLLVGLIGRELEARYGEDWARFGRLDVKFIAPIRSGDEARVELGEDGAVTVLVGDRTCVLGTARLAGMRSELR